MYAAQNKTPCCTSLVDAGGATSRIQEFTTYANATQAMLAARDSKIATLEGENTELRCKVKQLEKELAVHENYNNSTREARLYAKKRRQYRDDAANAKRGEESPGKPGESATRVDATAHGKTDGKQAPVAEPKRRGHKPGTPGKSHNNKPT